MASKVTFVSLTFLFFIATFSTFTGEAAKPTLRDLSQATSPSPSPSSASEITCSPDYASQRLTGVVEETKEFILRYLKSRIENKDKFDQKNIDCLSTCFNLYEAAVGIMEKAIQDLTLKRYSNAILALRGCQTTLASTLVCAGGANLTTVNPEFKGMKEWTYFNIEDSIIRIQHCGINLLDL